MRPRIRPKDKKRMCSALGARLGGSCVVPWDSSPLADISWADRAGRNLDASHRSSPATAPQNLPGPQNQGANPSPGSLAVDQSQDGDEVARSHRRAVGGWHRSPPGCPLPLIPSSPWSASPSRLVELHCLVMRCSGGVQEWALCAAELRLVPASAGRHATETHAGTADVPRSKPRETQADRDTQTLAPRPLVSGQDMATQAVSSGAIPREMLQI